MHLNICALKYPSSSIMQKYHAKNIEFLIIIEKGQYITEIYKNTDTLVSKET